MVHNEIVKNTKLKEERIHDGTTWIHINQYDTDKQNLEKKLDMLIKNARYESFSYYNCFKYKT